MIIGFKISNFRSFKDLQYFSMVAGKTRQYANHMVEINDKKILKFSGMYGANGSGKSNLILAMEILQLIINKGIDSLISNQYFRGDVSCQNKDSYFEYEFTINNKFYSYGFELNFKKKEIVSEWLIDMTKSSQKNIFSRDIKNSVSKGVFTKTTSIAKSCLEEMNSNNKELFLKETIRRLMMSNNDNSLYSELIDIYKFFTIDNIFIRPSTHKLFDTSYQSNKKIVLNLLKKMGINITDIKEYVSSISVIQSKMSILAFDNLQNELKIMFNRSKKERNLKCTLRLDNDLYTIIKENDEYKVSLLGFNHLNSKDVFGAYEESDGTIRILELIDIFTSKNKVFFIDELDSSLHPVLVKGLLNHYLEGEFQNQLIITTHEAITLDFDIVRRDEIWFAEKDDSGETRIYSLEEYKKEARFDKVIKNAYLEGRFGAVSKVDL